jgi:transcriptional regulator GlxA family with amidase domain
MRIALLALEGLFDTGLTVTLDAFAIANRISARQMGGTPFFEVSIVGVRKRVRSGQGFSIPVRCVTPDLKPDWVIVPALSKGMPDQLIRSLGRADVCQAKAELRQWRAEGVNIAASCIGTHFILAAAGLLENG